MRADDALRALDVRVDVIVDVNVLNDETVLKGLVEALGGDWAAIQAEASPLKKAIESKAPWLKSDQVAKDIH
jgi:hypothetical protein